MKTARITSSQERNRKAKSIKERVTKFAKTRGVKTSTFSPSIKTSPGVNVVGKVTRKSSLQPKFQAVRIPVAGKSSGRLPISNLVPTITNSRAPSAHLVRR